MFIPLPPPPAGFYGEPGHEETKPCGRKKCPNVGCERRMRVGDRGYFICQNCLDELRYYKEDRWPDSMPADLVLGAIEAFMTTEPGTHLPKTKLNKAEIDALFDRVTGGGDGT